MPVDCPRALRRNVMAITEIRFLIGHFRRRWLERIPIGVNAPLVVAFSAENRCPLFRKMP
jgi:hypothetical protein